ncbi:MAG: double-strand break repair helicase AddA [Pseudomonadota bacterium]|nr:double-strand break repair helicase AddA [Pseudomonadota bacterium]
MIAHLPENVSHQRRSANPANSAWVEASAGTGKTKVLVDRILSLLIHGSQAPHILCLTFTRSAAKQMEERLIERLLLWSTIPEKAVQREIQSLTGTPGNADQVKSAQDLYDRVVTAEIRPQFHTIHSFCETLLRKFPQEAGVENNFIVLDEQGSRNLLQKAKDTVLQQLHLSGDDQLQRDISCISQYSNISGFSTLLDLLIADRRRLEAFVMRNDSNSMARVISESLNLPTDSCPDLLVDTTCTDASIDVDGLRSSLILMQTGSKTDQNRAKIINEWLSAPQHERRKLFAKYCSAFLTRDQFPIKRLVSANTLAKQPDILSSLKTEQSRLVESTTKIKRAKISQCTTALLNLTKKILQQFSQEKNKQNCLDYDDLIIKVCIALTTGDASAWVLYKIDKSIDHLLIDEAQDTSLEQWEIIKSLTSEFFAGQGAEQCSRTIFAVGDYKQSIYGFQGASPDSFNRMRNYFRSRADDASAPWADIGLQVSFRSTSPILETVDSTFKETFANSTKAGANEFHSLKHFCWRDQAPGLVELWPILKPAKGQKVEVQPLPTYVSTQGSSRTTLARLVAKKISLLLSNSSCSHPQTFQPEDIMVLVRRRGPFVSDLLKELKTLKIPVTGIDRISLTDNIAVMDLVSLGNFLLNINDDLSLAEVLKSPLCNLDDRDLFDLAHNRTGSLWDSLSTLKTTNSHLQDARALLEDMLGKSTHFSPSELYADLIITRNYKKYFVSRIGADCIESINEFLNKSVEYESNNSPSLQGFIHWMQNNGSVTKREPAQNYDKAVKVLTVHGAKGLESPIVFLPDTVQKSRNNNPLLWLHSESFPIWIPNAALLDPLTQDWMQERRQREAEEYHRLLYVAMTRAKDQLYICGWSETPNVAGDCWHSIVDQSFTNVAEEASENILDIEGEIKISRILRLANFTPETFTMAETPSSFTTPNRIPRWITSNGEGKFPKPLFWRASTRKAPLSSLTTPELIANLVNCLYDLPESDREPAADKFVFHLAHQKNPDQLDVVKDWSLKILKSTDLSFLFQDNSQGCLPISGPIKHGRQTLLFHSSIDRLVDSEHSVLLVNFLVRSNCPGRAIDPLGPFVQDLAIKASLAQLVFPKKDVASAILWIDEQKLQNVSQDLLQKCLS